MKRQIYPLLVSLLLVIVLITSCNSPASGPQAWLDRPLNNSAVPLAPLIIQAHASGTSGVAKFEFYANDALISTANVSNNRFGEAIIEWTPTAPGLYTIKVKAFSPGGAPGEAATAQITVGGMVSTETAVPASNPLCNLAQLGPPELIEPADGATVTNPVHFAWGSPTGQGCHPQSWRVDISTLADFSDNSSGFGTNDHLETNRNWSLPDGVCYYWRVLAYTPDTYGAASVTRSFCITSTETATPTITPQTVIPTFTATSVPLPTATFTPTPKPDTSPPVFTYVEVSPTLILTQSNGCPSYPRVTVAKASVSDAEGTIASAWATWGVGTENGTIPLQSVGGSDYEGSIGPVTTSGILSVIFHAQDAAGNVAESGTVTITVQNCIE